MSAERINQLAEVRVDLDYIAYGLREHHDQIVPYIELTTEARDIWIEWTRDLLAELVRLAGEADKLADAADRYINWHKPRIVPTAETPDQKAALYALKDALTAYRQAGEKSDT